MTATTESIGLAKAAAHAADELKATTVIALDVSEHLALTDIFVIASADNERQVNAIVDSVEDALLERGVYAPPSAYEAWFVSAALDEDAFSQIADALPAAAQAAATAATPGDKA